MDEEVIIEIRAGVGGEEASLFALDLWRMYSKFAEKRGWKITLLNLRESELGGVKEVVFQLKGDNAYSEMKYEAGVHRVQRIPKTERAGRIHTSTATVAVLKVVKDNELKIHPSEIRFDFFKASGPGGQYVNKRMSAVRITHLPTNISVTCQTERSLQQNKEMALELLRSKLAQLQENKRLEEITKERRAQIKSAERSEKIRTYNFVQNRVTDHRVKRNWHNLEEVLEGKLDKIIEALKDHYH